MFTELMRDVLAEEWEVDCGLRTKWSSTGEVILIHALLLFITYLSMVKASLLSQTSLWGPVDFSGQTFGNLPNVPLFPHVPKQDCCLPQVS